jgi:subtilisin family serine protease
MNHFRVLSHDDPLYPLQPTAALWHLADLHRVATGRNVRVAAIDSGVELDHPDLTGRVMLARNFVDARNAVAEMHGTAVAGIIGARADNGVGIVGVAPDARLMALRACWQAPSGGSAAICSSFTLAKALQFAIDNNAQVINLSLGGPRDRLLERLLAIAASRGTVIVAAADSRFADGGFPASLSGVLAVAADDAQDAPEAIYLAPGRDIPTTLPGRRWGLVGGSSYAAAQVAGLVALLIDLAPDQNFQQIRETLSTSERSAAAPRQRAIVDACAAVARTVRACACGCRIAGDVSVIPVH